MIIVKDLDTYSVKKKIAKVFYSKEMLLSLG